MSPFIPNSCSSSLVDSCLKICVPSDPLSPLQSLPPPLLYTLVSVLWWSFASILALTISHTAAKAIYLKCHLDHNTFAPDPPVALHHTSDKFCRGRLYPGPGLTYPAPLSSAIGWHLAPQTFLLFLQHMQLVSASGCSGSSSPPPGTFFSQSLTGLASSPLLHLSVTSSETTLFNTHFLVSFLSIFIAFLK